MELIKVLAQFDGTKVKPLAFRRQNRLYKIKNLNMVYHLKEGDQTVFRFFVSDEANTYQLRFETETLQWFLEED